MRIFRRLRRFARKSPREMRLSLQAARGRFNLRLEDWGWKIPRLGNDRTGYVIGLFGSGRIYLNRLIMQNLGTRAKYFRDTIRIHPGPTSMIYSGHATIRHASRFQVLPAVTSCILEAVRLRFADLIFIFRHPLDSLLTNWIWWRTFLRSGNQVLGISEIYNNPEDFCADLERNFSEFRLFAEGSPDFFQRAPGPRFLSLAEFVEETELHLQSASLALRFEDFRIDPAREFSKVIEVMSVEGDLSRFRHEFPASRLYRYREARDKVPQFRGFIEGLETEIKRRIEAFGYALD